MHGDESNDDDYEQHNGYDGTRAPLHIEELNCEHEPAALTYEDQTIAGIVMADIWMRVRDRLAAERNSAVG